MKFSELETDRAMDVFCELVPYIENITSDTELLEVLKKKMNITDETTNAEKWAMVIEKINGIAPVVLKKRKDDVLSIVAIVNGKKLEEVKKQNIIKTMIDIREIIRDKDFLDFFKSFGGLAGGAR